MKTKLRVTGLGGVFFKAKNTKKLQAWYQKHLGLPLDPNWGGMSFEWREAKRPEKKGCTVWSAFEPDTEYFGPGKQTFMLNYRVADLKREGVWVDAKTESSEFGKFGWIKDGEGNRIELWQPPPAKRKTEKKK